MSEKAFKEAGYGIIGNFVYDGNTPVGQLEPLENMSPEGNFLSNAFTSLTPIFRKSSGEKSLRKEYAESIAEESIKSIIKSMGLDIKYKSQDEKDRHELYIFTDNPKKVVLAAKTYVKYCKMKVYDSMSKVSDAFLKKGEWEIEQFTDGIKKIFQKELLEKP